LTAPSDTIGTDLREGHVGARFDDFPDDPLVLRLVDVLASVHKHVAVYPF